MAVCGALQARFWLCLCLTGCVSDQAHRYYLDERYPPKDVEDVEVLWRAPEEPYTVIADFQARPGGLGPGIRSHGEWAAEYMQKKAAQIGADAVIVGTYGGYRAKGDEWAGIDRHSETYSRITGTAIKYKR